MKIASSEGVVITQHLALVHPVDLGEVTVPRRRDLPVRVVDERGQGVADFRLVVGSRQILAPRNSILLPATVMAFKPLFLDDLTALTDAGGRAVLPLATPVRRIGGKTLHVVAGAGDERFVHARLAPDQASDDVELVARPLVPARIIDATGRPAAGVLAYHPDPFGVTRTSSSSSRATATWKKRCKTLDSFNPHIACS